MASLFKTIQSRISLLIKNRAETHRNRAVTHYGAIDSKRTIVKLSDPVVNWNANSFFAPPDGWRWISSDFTI